MHVANDKSRERQLLPLQTWVFGEHVLIIVPMCSEPFRSALKPGGQRQPVGDGLEVARDVVRRAQTLCITYVVAVRCCRGIGAAWLMRG
jgi:hypothetical protein